MDEYRDVFSPRHRITAAWDDLDGHIVITSTENGYIDIALTNEDARNFAKDLLDLIGKHDG